MAAKSQVFRVRGPCVDRDLRSLRILRTRLLDEPPARSYAAQDMSPVRSLQTAVARAPLLCLFLLSSTHVLPPMPFLGGHLTTEPPER